MRKPSPPTPATPAEDAPPSQPGWRNLFGHCVARKPRSDGEQSRERLLRSAHRLFAEQGYRANETDAGRAQREKIRQRRSKGGADYFGDPAEMLARAFEAYTAARVEAVGGDVSALA